MVSKACFVNWGETTRVMDRALHSVPTYMDVPGGPVYFNVRRFKLIFYHQHDRFIYDVQMHEDRLPGVGGWARRS